MSDIAKVMKMIKDKELKFVDLRFTDTKVNGSIQHRLLKQLMKILLRMESCLMDHLLLDGKTYKLI